MCVVLDQFHVEHFFVENGWLFWKKIILNGLSCCLTWLVYCHICFDPLSSVYSVLFECVNGRHIIISRASVSFSLINSQFELFLNAEIIDEPFYNYKAAIANDCPRGLTPTLNTDDDLGRFCKVEGNFKKKRFFHVGGIWCFVLLGTSIIGFASSFLFAAYQR